MLAGIACKICIVYFGRAIVYQEKFVTLSSQSGEWGRGGKLAGEEQNTCLIVSGLI